MRFRLIILTLLAFANHARAELLTADGVFSIVESDTSYSLSLSTGGSSVASPRVTGNIPVTITFDTETLKASGLTLGDAGVLWWDTFSLRVNSNVRINGVGTLPFTIITEFQNVGTEVFRIGSNVGVNPVTGELNTADFRLITNRGQASVSMEAGGASEFQTGYYSETPEDSPLSKAPVLKIERIRDDIYGFQYDFSLEIEINETVSERIPDTNLTIAASEQAKLLAKFSHEGKTAFGDWYEYNQPLYDSEDLDAKSPTGVPMYLAFALGHDHYNTLYEAPYRGITFQGKTYLSINSPYRRDDVSVIYSHSLEEGSWNPIPGEWLADGPESLLKGSRRNISVNIPDDTPALFIKVLATPPALSN